MTTLARWRIHPAITHWRITLATLLALLGAAAAALAWVGYAHSGVSEPVVVAARPIPPGTRLRAEDVRVVQAARGRPAAWRGVADPRFVIGAYTRIPLVNDQVVDPEHLQASPVGAAVVWPDGKAGEGLPEVVQGVVFELKRDGLRSVRAGNRVNIIALVDPKRGADPSFSLGWLDRPGSGARAVRVLRGLRVLGVEDRAVLLDVTPEESRYLWSLAAAEVPFVGEVSAAEEVGLGPLTPEQFGNPQGAPDDGAAEEVGLGPLTPEPFGNPQGAPDDGDGGTPLAPDGSAPAPAPTRPGGGGRPEREE